jgi:SEC-C motif-containing protein
MKDCPCGLQSPYSDCCGPLIRGTGYADTAEDLMRSRYTAYTLRNWDYLIQTTHSSERSEKTRKAFEKWGKSVEWLKLEVLGSKKGGLQDDEGEVTFVAFYEEEGEEHSIRESSKFLKENGRWTYSEKQSTIHKKVHEEPQQPVIREGPKVGRNDPCPCGSGKKFKKCCGK